MTELLLLPTGETARRALDWVQRTEERSIANHSVRTFLHARVVAASDGLVAGLDFDTELLFLACVLHDIGTTAEADGDHRFEVDGADAAARFLAAEGLSAADTDLVWEAIALHTSPQIAERRGPVTRLTRLGVRGDFGLETVAAAEREAIEDAYPRLNVEKNLGDAVLEQALRNPQKAPRNSWPASLVQAHAQNPHATGVSEAF
jgi:HD superfamily phosphodiesterase